MKKRDFFDMTNRDTDEFIQEDDEGFKLSGAELWFDGFHIATIREDSLPASVVARVKRKLAG